MARPRSQISRRKEAGDTLVEVLIALAIIGLVTVPLLTTLGTALTASAQHRHLATFDTLLKSFADTATSELELAPPGTGYPSYSACPSASTYNILSPPTPTSGPVGTAVTVFATGFVGATPSNVTVTVSSTPAVVSTSQSGSADPSGNIPITFFVPPALTPGTYPIKLTYGSMSATSLSGSGITVNSNASVSTTSPVKGYTLGISSIYSWDSTLKTFDSNPNPPCTAATDYGLQQINLTAGAPGISDTLNFVVRNPADVAPPKPTPQVTVVGAPSPGTATAPLMFTASVTAATGYPPPTGSVTWTVKNPSGTVVLCTGGSSLGSPSGSTATATCTVSGTNTTLVGTYSATAAYAGDAYNNPTNGSGSAAVVTTPTVTVTDNNPSVGGSQGLIFTATVTPPNNTDPEPTGAVNWSNTFQTTGPAVPVGCTSTTGPTLQTPNKAVWTCTINPAQAGIYSTTATVDADTNYTTASGSDSRTVPKVNPNLTMASNTPNAMLVFTFTVTGVGTGVNAVVPTGTVSWGITPCTSTTPPTVSGVTITATCTINPALSTVTYTATATYSGDTNYNGGSKSAQGKG